MRALLFFAIFAMSFTACKPKTQQGNTAEAAAPAPAWPTLPIEILRTLVAECDYIDLIMYNAMTEQGAAFYAQVLNQLRQGAPQ